MPDDDDDNIIVGVGNWFIVEALFIMETYDTTTMNWCMVGRWSIIQSLSPKITTWVRN